MLVICLTDASGFPYGEAIASRILLIGKALRESNTSFEVYTLYFNKNHQNNIWHGNHEGIYFQYLHKSVGIHKKKAIKLLLAVYGYLRLSIKLIHIRKSETVIYLYSQGSVFNLIVLILSKIIGIKVIEEINEWKFNPFGIGFKKFMYHGPMVRWSNGALVISESIRQNVSHINKNLKLFKLPILQDFNTKIPLTTDSTYPNPFFLWVGHVDVYYRDVIFAIDAVRLLNNKGINITCLICGRFSNDTYEKHLKSHVGETVRFLGYVPDDMLNSLMSKAVFFLLPLWNDRQSHNRFATKLALYLAYSKPVLTCAIGEVCNHLTDKQNVLFYKENDIEDLVEKIIFLLNNPEISKQIGINGRLYAEMQFNYRNYSESLHGFFKHVLTS